MLRLVRKGGKENRTGKQTTIHYWRKLVREAGLDPDNVEMYARDRNKWKNQIKIRMEEIREWEEQMAGKHRGNEQEVENITRNRKINSISHCNVIWNTVGGCARQKQD